MSANNNNPKTINNYRLWRIFNMVIVGILIGAVIIIIYFVHYSINQALINTATVINLKNEMTFDKLDLIKYKETNRLLENKQNKQLVNQEIRNIFLFTTNEYTEIKPQIKYEKTTSTSTTTTITDKQ